jgi:pSer/pThr/pTyr-binding forkhead associated (FHA) protein
MSKKTSTIISVGRSDNCNYVILDPPRKVSRHHLDVIKQGDKIFITDKSSNGTIINGKKVQKDSLIEVNITDSIMLAGSHRLDLQRVIASGDLDSEKTRILPNSKQILTDGNIELSINDKTVLLNANKTEIGEILSMDNSSFLTIGRSTDCHYIVDNSSVSKHHCRIRLIDPRLIEIEDLESTNGTFADGERLKPRQRIRYTSAVELRLGNNTSINLAKILPGIQIIRPNQIPNSHSLNQTTAEITKTEKKAFEELETIWREYQERQNSIINSGSGIAIGGMAASSLIASILSGPVGIIVGVGGSLMARYISQQKTSKLRSDFSYEDMFLQVYSCPRCKESFQKKPWITIRECLKCKIKFR